MLIRFLQAAEVDVTRAGQGVSFPTDEVADVAGGVATDLIKQGIARAATAEDVLAADRAANADLPAAKPKAGSFG